MYSTPTAFLEFHLTNLLHFRSLISELLSCCRSVPFQIANTEVSAFWVQVVQGGQGGKAVYNLVVFAPSGNSRRSDFLQHYGAPAATPTSANSRHYEPLNLLADRQHWVLLKLAVGCMGPFTDKCLCSWSSPRTPSCSRAVPCAL